MRFLRLLNVLFDSCLQVAQFPLVLRVPWSLPIETLKPSDLKAGHVIITKKDRRS